MTNKEQRKFLKDLIKVVSEEIDREADRIPSRWKGYELRAYLAHCFDGVEFKHSFTGRSKADYENDLLVNNL